MIPLLVNPPDSSELVSWHPFVLWFETGIRYFPESWPDEPESLFAPEHPRPAETVVGLQAGTIRLLGLVAKVPDRHAAREVANGRPFHGIFSASIWPDPGFLPDLLAGQTVPVACRAGPEPVCSCHGVRPEW